jgi:hypothetical protein
LPRVPCAYAPAATLACSASWKGWDPEPEKGYSDPVHPAAIALVELDQFQLAKVLKIVTEERRIASRTSGGTEGM